MPSPGVRREGGAAAVGAAAYFGECMDDVRGRVAGF
jgi:hypothetical protein